MSATSSTPSPAAPADNPASVEAEPNGRKKILLIIGSIFLLGAIVWVAYWLLIARHVEETDDAYVQGNVVQITPQLAGTINRILVDDTDVVRAGQALIQLDTADADIALAQAESQLAQTVREVRTLFTGQAQSNANLSLRRTELARAQDDLARRRALAGTGAVSAEEIRHAESAVASAQAAITVASEQLASGRALTANTTISQHPNVLRAASRLQETLLARSRTTLYAPIGGQIAKRSAQVGQRINPGAALMAVVPLDQLWVDANFKESQLRNMHIGQAVTLESDLYGSKTQYDGKIVGMGAGTGSAFALLPAQNATGNWIKVVQRLPVRISLDPIQLIQHPLRLGLSITARVDLRDQDDAHGGKKSENTIPSGSAIVPTPDKNSIAALSQARVAAIIAAN